MSQNKSKANTPVQPVHSGFLLQPLGLIDMSKEPLKTQVCDVRVSVTSHVFLFSPRVQVQLCLLLRGSVWEWVDIIGPDEAAVCLVHPSSVWEITSIPYLPTTLLGCCLGGKKLFVGSDVIAMSLAITSDMLYLCARLLLTRLGWPSLFWCASVTISTMTILSHRDILGNTTNPLPDFCLVFKHKQFVGHSLEMNDLGKLPVILTEILIPKHFKLHCTIYMHV